MKPLPPGTRIGLLGGGQLARMLTLAGTAMGFSFTVLDPTPNNPAVLAGADPLTAPYDDPDALKALAATCAVVTYEFENVPATTVEQLEQITSVPQGSALLTTCQHRLREKTALQALGVPVTPFAAVASVDDLHAFFETHGPTMLKTATGGYDGKGQVRIEQASEVEAAFAQLSASGRELIAERIFTFAVEASVMVARSTSGAVACYPVGENFHERNILTFTRIPAKISPETQARAEQVARQVAEGLQLVGLLGVELFVSPDGDLVVNELAPRPHNSGHWTQNAAATCQFEQHLRAITGWPLGQTDALAPVVMLNILGEHLPHLLTALPHLPPNAHVHLYGKPEARPGRKMGHVNLVLSDSSPPLDALKALSIWRPEVLDALLHP